MFSNIPHEMRSYNQWIAWRLEHRENAKPTKVPYQLNGYKASVTDPKSWCSFDEAVHACPNPDYTTLDPKGFSGIGFVLANSDPYSFIDLDDCHDDALSYERQVKIYREFDSYSEHSPSKTGLHIIVKGSLPEGRRRSNIEVYSSERYMTMTGDVYNDREIVDRSQLLNLLYNEMGAPPATILYGDDQTEKWPDEDIFKTATGAVNGDKFLALYEGRWENYYPSQSEADFALIDILAFYTQNRAQISRMFGLSVLGERTKARRAGYINAMIERSFDRQLPPIDIDGLRIKGELLLKSTTPAKLESNTGVGVHSSEAPSTTDGNAIDAKVIFPPGLVGEIADFILEAAPRPNRTIALAGALGLMAGVAGRAYNFSASGLNQYILVIAETGTGKEAISSGISRLMSMIKPSVSAATTFVGPGQIASYQGVVKWLIKAPSFVSIIGEFGNKLRAMTNERASPHLAGIMTFMLEVYSKSGKGQVFDPGAYAEVAKNTPAIYSPNFSLVGETTPETFYQVLNEQMIATGFLPRFTIFEYKGISPYLSKTYATARPSFSLVEGLSALMAQCLSSQTNNNVHEITATPEAQAMLDNFDVYSTDKRNSTKSEMTKQLWNRAHLKAARLAGLIAVGINYNHPLITVNEVGYTTDLVCKEIESLIDRFEQGDVGLLTDNSLDEYKQAKDLAEILNKWFKPGSKVHLKYKLTDEMQQDFVFSWNSVQTRLFSQQSFKNDRYGPTSALKKAIQYFIDAGDIAEIPKMQGKAKYGTTAKLYCITNLSRFTLQQ